MPAEPAPADVITTEVRDHVLIITLARAAKKNAFDVAMLRALAAAYTRLDREPDLRCGLVRADGSAFTAGLDLAEVGPLVASGAALFASDADSAPAIDDPIDPLDLRAPWRRKPVVMAVHGYCFTIGIELMLAADVRLAATDTTFAQMEVQRGIMPFGGATLRFAAQCGWGNAMRWMLTGARFDATEALRIGLVQEVVPPDALHERALAVALEIAQQAPLAVQATRANARVARDDGIDAAQEALMPAARALFATDDAREGVASFVGRRQARFTGR